MLSTEIKRDYQRLTDFIEERKKDVYREAVDMGHFTKGGIDSIKHLVKPGDKILDVGCGHGVALDMFKDLGAIPIGVTLCEEDAKEIRFMNHDVRVMDMSFMDFEDEYFDIVWARHSLEHSIMPFFTLSEFHRVLKRGGTIYLEMPSIRTDAHHESNFNHYSVFESKMWANLILRTGFVDLEAYTISLDLTDYARGEVYGKDEYYRFLAVKPLEMPSIIELAL